MLRNQFFSLFQVSLWSVLLSEVGLAGTSDNEDNDGNSGGREGGGDGGSEEVREFLVSKLRVWF